MWRNVGLSSNTGSAVSAPLAVDGVGPTGRRGCRVPPSSGPSRPQMISSGETQLHGSATGSRAVVLIAPTMELGGPTGQVPDHGRSVRSSTWSRYRDTG